MKAIEMKDEQILQIADLLEQMRDVNRMIELHQDDEDDFMLAQYVHRKEKFVKELAKLLSDFNIDPKDLAA